MATAQQDYKWNATKQMPTKRVFATAVCHGDHLYIIGGCDGQGQPLDTFESYNLKKQKWERLASLITKRAGSTAVVVSDDRIVVLSGVSVNQEPLDTVEMYSIKDKKWSPLEAMTEKLLGVSAVVKDSKIYTFGGMATDTSPRDYFFCYDLETNIWKKLLSMPTPRYATGCFLIEEKIYIIGGRQGKLPVAAFEVYDFVESKWSKLTNIPSKRVFPNYTTNNTHIFSIAGLNENPKDGFCNACEVYDIEKAEWINGTAVPTNRGDFAIGILGNLVVVAGGLGNEGKPLTSVEAYDYASNNWTKFPDMASAHSSCAYVVNKDKLFVAGGISMQGPSGNMDILSAKESK